jgi:hypothetical protein
MSDSGYQLSPKEWDFSNCPKEELEECWWYEFKRQLPHERQIIINWRQTCVEQTFDGFFKLHRMMLMPPAPGHVYALCPEWPKYPFLSIPSDERARRLKQFFPDRTKSLADQLTPWPAEPTLYGLIQEFEGKRERPSARSQGDDILPRVWHKSNQEIVSFIKAWLATHRPDKTQIDTSIRRLKTDLKALGVRRIWEFCNYDWGKIYDGNWVGDKRLPRQQGEWSKAIARAEKVIRNLSS